MIARSVLFERCAGRDEEIAHLVDARARSLRELSGVTVAVSGEAGVGKSRLLREFAAATKRERGACVRVRCEELPVAYAPFIAALEGLKGRHELRRSEKIGVALTLLTAPDLTANRDAAERKRAISSALVAALGEAARRTSHLTLAVDDVHWSDLSSLEAMHALARSIGTVPLLLIVTYRTEDLVSEPARALAISNIERESASRIALTPLHYPDIASLLRETLPHASHELLRRIFDLSEGKPYVAEELARSVVEIGREDEPENALTLRGAVLGRVARLSPEDRAIVERAAVLGRNFASNDLYALGATRERLASAMRGGLDLQVFEEREVGGESWFRFRHALTREILYRSLPAEERRALHLEIARYLDDDPARIAELAYHYAAAGEADRAARASEAAGERAAGIAAYSDAAKLFRRALDFATGAETLARVGRRLAESLERAGDLDDLLATLPRDVERLVDAGRNDDAIAILTIAIRALTPTRRAEAIAFHARARGLMDAFTRADVRFEIELACAEIERREYRNVESLEACARAEACLSEPTPHQRKALLLSQASTYMHLSELTKAQVALELRLHEATGDGDSDDAETFAAMTKVSYRRGALRTALAQCRETAARWQRLGHERNAFFHQCNAALVASDIGEFAIVAAALCGPRHPGIEGSEALEAARVRTLLAVGGDHESLARSFERTIETGTLFSVGMFGRDIPFMLAHDRPRAAAIATRVLDRIPADVLDSEIVETVVEFCDDAVMKRALDAFFAIATSETDLWLSTGIALVRARVARRGNRTIEQVARANEALVLARRMENWRYVASALELGNDFTSARESLAAIGAKAEIARLDRRHARASEAGRAQRHAAPTQALTQREDQVARLIATGLSMREVGERLAIGPRTVETHLANVFEKLGIASRAELAAALTHAR